jgi:hypothetical protein
MKIKCRYCKWGRRGMHAGFLGESQKETDHWEDQDVNVWTILKLVLERYSGIIWTDMDEIVLAGDRDRWRALVNTVMNLHDP